MQTVSVLLLAVMAAVSLGLVISILIRARARRLLAWRVWLIPFAMLGADLSVAAAVARVNWLYLPGAALILGCYAVSAIAARLSRHRSGRGRVVRGADQDFRATR